MIVLSNSLEQTVQPGQAIAFDTIVQHTGCGECFRLNSTSVLMRAKGGTYECHFNGNIGGETAATPVQLVMAETGAPLQETLMISTPAAVGDLNNVGAATLVKNCCCECDRITVMNNGTEPVVVGADCCLFVKRVG